MGTQAWSHVVSVLHDDWHVGLVVVACRASCPACHAQAAHGTAVRATALANLIIEVVRERAFAVSVFGLMPLG